MPTVAASVDVVVHLARGGDGVRRVTEIAAVPGRIEGGVVEVADVFVRTAGRLVRADGWPPRPERFAAAGIDLDGILRPREQGVEEPSWVR